MPDEKEMPLLNKVIIGVVVASMLWCGRTLYNMSIIVAVNTSLLQQLTKERQDRYTGTQAIYDKAELVKRIERLEAGK